jgi:hypothetical protein
MEEAKPLSRWRFELQSIGKKHWLVFYREMLGTPASSIPRLYRALNNYGFWPLFEAIVDSSERELTGDPLNYVVAVAKNKWKEAEEEDSNSEVYISEIEEAKKKSQQQNEELAKKLKKVK